MDAKKIKNNHATAGKSKKPNRAVKRANDGGNMMSDIEATTTKGY